MYGACVVDGAGAVVVVGGVVVFVVDVVMSN